MYLISGSFNQRRLVLAACAVIATAVGDRSIRWKGGIAGSVVRHPRHRHLQDRFKPTAATSGSTPASPMRSSLIDGGRRFSIAGAELMTSLLP